MHRRGLSFGVLVAAAIASALGWHHVGPYRWLADVQLRAHGSYYPALTWAVLMLVIGLPLGAVASVIAARASLPDGEDEWFVQYRWLVFSRSGQLIVLGAALALAGGLAALRAYTIGEVTPLSVAALERGEPLRGSYVELVDGTPDPTRSIEVDHRTYVPVFGARDVAAVFLEIRATRDGAMDRGLVSEGSLPNLARVWFEDARMIAEPHYVIEAGWTPVAEVGSRLSLVAFGLLLFGIGATVRIMTRAS